MNLAKAFKILGLAAGDFAGVEKAHRDLVKKWHPDRHPGDKVNERRFQDINAARDFLRDPKNRVVPTPEPEDDSTFDSLVREFHARRRHRGEDLHAEVWMTLEEAAQGCIKELEVARWVLCQKCKGAGGQDPSECVFCNGKGISVQVDGPIRIHTPCIACGGRGKTFKVGCSCKLGREITVDQFNVPFKAGVSDGYTLAKRGGGCEGIEGAESGDLYIRARILAHDRFDRDGDHLFQIWPISIVLACLGGKIDVPTLLDGPTPIVIPPGTQPGTVITVPHKGVTKAADMYVALRVDVPKELTERQRALLKEFAQEG